ncbi:MAG TPA: hypothetical protein VIS07_08535 [Candidatus Binatia bacterium]
MKILTRLAAVAALVGTTAVAQAATLSSPMLPTFHATDFVGGSMLGNAAACYVRNVGKKPVKLEVKFQQNFGSDLPSSFQNCNAVPLAPGRTCVALINDLPDDVAFGCTAVVSGSAKNVRASVEFRALTVFGQKVLVAEDLR